MSEYDENDHAISMVLSNVNLTENLPNHHRILRHDREPGRIPIRSLDCLRNEKKKIFENLPTNLFAQVYPSPLKCILM